MVRFICPTLAAQKVGDSITLSPEDARHAKVLRVREGENVELLNMAGVKAEGIYSKAGIVLNKLQKIPRGEKSIRLCVGLTQGGTFDQIVRQAAELGCENFLPVLSQKASPIGEAKRLEGKLARWRKISEEVCKQSGRAWKMEVEQALDFPEALKKCATALNIVAALVEDSRPLSHLKSPSQEVTLWVGPEGDFSDEEYRELKKSGAQFATLGENILRTETAVVVALAILKSL